MEEISLISPEGNVPVIPFKIGRNDSKTNQVFLHDIEKVYCQNNYTNQVLRTMSQQVNMISTQIEAILKEHEIDSLTKKLEKLYINNNNKKNEPNFLDDIASPYLK